MRSSFLHGLLVCLATGSATAGDYSYVVLNSSDHHSLVRLAPDGQFLATIADGAVGRGLTKDRSGNYIIAAVGSLRKVTPSGIVSTIARAPAGSQWMSVLEDTTGDFIVVDNQLRTVWRVSQDGKSLTKLVESLGPSGNLVATSIVLDNNGNYLILEDDDCHFDKITPAGILSRVNLNHKVLFCKGLVPDGPGAYLSAAGKGGSIVRITEGGEVIEIAKFSPAHRNVTGVARDPETGELMSVANIEHSLLRTSASGQTTIMLSNDRTYLPYPTAILVETGK